MMKLRRYISGHVLYVAIQLISVYAYLGTGNSNNQFYDLEPPQLIEPGSIGQTLVFLNDTGLVIPCRAAGQPAPLTTWILASKLFDSTELYSAASTDHLTTNNKETIHNFHLSHLHRSTNHQLNDNLIINNEQFLNSRIQNLTRYKRTLNKLNYHQLDDQHQLNWLNDNFKLKELPGLRYIRSDGALVFPPFSSSFYSPSIHHTGYVCVSWNKAGTIISAQINVKAVVNSQVFPIDVNDESTIVGGSVVFKCSIPNSENSFSKIEQWTVNDALTINRESLIDERSKYVMLTTGELLVRHVSVNDIQLKFNCHVRRLLNGELLNSKSGKILLYATNLNSTSDGITSDQLTSNLSKNNGQIVNTISNSLARITFISPSIVLEQFYEASSNLPEYILHGTAIIGKPYNLHNSILNSIHHNAAHLRSTTSESIPSLLNQINLSSSFKYPNDLKLKRLVLACISSVSKAQYSWLRNGLPIVSNENIQQLGELLIIKLYRPFNSIKYESDYINDLVGRFECRVTNFTNSTNEPMEMNRQLDIKVTRRLHAKFLSNAQVIKAGQRAELNCTIEGLFTTIDWFKDGKQLLLNGNSHLFTSNSHHSIDSSTDHHSHSHLLLNNYSKLRDNKNSNEDLINNQKTSYSAILKLRAVKRENSGIYQCVARDGIQSAQASIRLVVEDEPPRFLEVFTERELPLSSSISIKCTASGNPLPQILWEIDGIPLDSTSGVSGILDSSIMSDSPVINRNDASLGNSISQIQNVPSLANELNNLRIGDYVTSDGLVVSFVNISSLEPSHGGLYKCSAYSELAVISHQAEIRIQDAKLFVRPMRNQRLVAHNDLKIRCPVTYSPDNVIEWYKGTNLSKLPANHRQSSYPNGTLFISAVDKTDEGEYRCIVRNGKNEQAQSSFQLIIQVAPKIEPFQLPNNIQINQRLSITCTAIKGDPPLLLSWYKDGRLIDEKLAQELEFKLHQLEEFSSTLLFHRVRAEHRANYTCRGKNAVAEDSYSQLMTIYEPPQWTYEPTDQTAIKGKKLWIGCRAHGFPRPNISWKVFDNSNAKYRTIVSSFHLQILDNGTLYIENVQKSDSGSFLCQASNGIDQDLSKVVRLNVYEQAHFRIKFKSQTVQIGESISLSCEAFGEFPITLTWLKENNLITADNASGRGNSIDLKHGNGSLLSTFTISTAERRDSALYSCSARNQFGQDHTTIQLIVQEPPDSPNELKLNEIKSRSVTITWQLPFTGNARVEQMRLSLKELSTNTKPYLPDGIRNLTFSPLQSLQWTIGELQPYTNYSLTLTAINALGESPPSEPLLFQTEEEVPSESPKHIKAFPLSTKSIRITWNPPETRYSFGKIRGYYVGYKELHSSAAYIYKTITVDGHSTSNDLKSNGVWQSNQPFKAETVLKNLKRNTKYEVIIQGFNTKGGGTLSEKIYAQTFHEDAPKTPQITSTKVNYNSVTINWKYDNSDSQATGFKLQCISTSNQIIEKTLHGSDIDTFTFNKLQCGSTYQFTIQSYNSVGFSDKTQPIYIKTNGSVPVAPSKDLLIQFLNSTTVELNLAAWKGEICLIQRFSIKYRRRNEAIYTILSTNSQWSSSSHSYIDSNGYLIESNQIGNQIGNNNQIINSNHLSSVSSIHNTSSQSNSINNQFDNDDLSVLNNFKSDSSNMESDGRLLIDGLHPQTWYELKISAFSEAGNTEADYSFFTHSTDKSRPSVSMAYDSSLYSVLMEFEVLIPLCLSIIVVAAVIILLYMVVTKRTTLNRSNGLFDHNNTIVDPLTGCVSQTKTNPFPTLQTKLNDGLSLVNMDSPNKLMMDCMGEDCCTATTNTNSSNNSPAISVSSQPHCYLQRPHCQLYADTMQTLQHNQVNQLNQMNQSNYYPTLPCPYASVTVNENGIQEHTCSTLPNNGIYLKQLCDFTNATNIQCNQLAAQFNQNTLAQNLNNLNSLPNLTNLTANRKLLDESQYATVKRTARKAQDRNNIYDYPVKNSHVTITENLFEDTNE